MHSCDKVKRGPFVLGKGWWGVSCACACANVLTARNTLLLAELRINTV